MTVTKDNPMSFTSQIFETRSVKMADREETIVATLCPPQDVHSSLLVVEV